MFDRFLIQGLYSVQNRRLLYCMGVQHFMEKGHVCYCGLVRGSQVAK
jgi:hypothetical protein